MSLLWTRDAPRWALTVRAVTAVMLALTAFMLIRNLVFAQADPSGEATLEADPTVGLTFVWTLLSGALVFFMQAGFAFLGAGLIRAKNTVNYLTKNILDFAAGGLSFWAFGYAFMFGGSGAFPGLEQGNAFIGYSGFFLVNQAYDVSTAMFWFFQMVFAATTATIVAGAVAERTKVTAYLAYSFLVTAAGVPDLRALDVGRRLAGRRAAGKLDRRRGRGLRRFWRGSHHRRRAGAGRRLHRGRPHGASTDPTAEVRDLRGHNMVYVVIGTFILFFGWFGFNAGSTVNGNDPRIAVIIANTFLAGAAGAVTAAYIRLVQRGKISASDTANGALAGLVGVTAPCAFIAPWAAVVVGAVGAIVMLVGVWFIDTKLKIDDPIGASSVHGVAGVWGLLAVGIFADGHLRRQRLRCRQRDPVRGAVDRRCRGGRLGVGHRPPALPRAQGSPWACGRRPRRK